MEKEFDNCLLCGKNNPIGLKLEFTYSDQMASCMWLADPRFEGYPDIIHGGIVTALMDEAMAKTMLHQHITAVTTDIQVKFKKPMKVSETYLIKGQLIEQKKRICLCKAWISLLSDPDEIIAQSEAQFWIIST